MEAHSTLQEDANPKTGVEHSIVAGARVAGRGGVQEAFSPASAVAIGAFSLLDETQTPQAAAAAAAAFGEWAATSFSVRRRILDRVRTVLVEEAESMAVLISREQGKPVAEAHLAEILPALDHLKHLASHAEEILTPQETEPAVFLIGHKQARIEFKPIGPVLIITPWNYPFSIPLTGIAAALMAGNSVVLKPAPATTLIGLAIGDLFARAGLPPGVLNVVACDDTVAASLVKDPRFRKILFTGSVPTGRRIMASAAGQGTPVTLELGGKDPAVVCADADLERAASGIVWAAFLNAGQTCASVERVYVEEAVADVFITKVIEKTKAIRMGDPLDAGTDMGPLTLERQRAIVEGHVEDARARGARIETGGQRPEGPGHFYPPTVLTNVDHTMAVMRDETFGPVLPIMRVKTVDEGIRLANDSAYGLTASGWTSSEATAEKLERELQAGVVTINDHVYTFSEPTSPWGGIKASGIGRTHGSLGLREMTQPKYVARDMSRGGEVWWYPYGPEFKNMMAGALRSFHHPFILARLFALSKLSLSKRYLARGRKLRVIPDLFKLF
ncbi:MAG: aldehyde dehydrogenase family protein [Vicinamibacteria bacterium]|nr:aldehyde dehydrogenase family protein [Vicinamibacteria bacterium]